MALFILNFHLIDSASIQQNKLHFFLNVIFKNPAHFSPLELPGFCESYPHNYNLKINSRLVNYVFICQKVLPIPVPYENQAPYYENRDMVFLKLYKGFLKPRTLWFIADTYYQKKMLLFCGPPSPIIFGKSIRQLSANGPLDGFYFSFMMALNYNNEMSIH